MRSGPSECPFVRSRRSHRPLPYTSPHRRTRGPFRRPGAERGHPGAPAEFTASPRRDERCEHSRPSRGGRKYSAGRALARSRLPPRPARRCCGPTGPSLLPCTSGAAYRPLASWPQTETRARGSARISILDRAFSLVRGCGQGQDRTADLPFFRPDNHPGHGKRPSVESARRVLTAACGCRRCRHSCRRFRAPA